MKRKTIKVSDVVEAANRTLRDSENDMIQHRQSIITFVDGIFMRNDSYRGKAYLHEGEVEKGKTFGISFDEKENHTFHDQTRMKYL